MPSKKQPSTNNKFVRPSNKLLQSADKPVLPGHLIGEYAIANAHDLFGILPEPEKENIPCGNSSKSSTE